MSPVSSPSGMYLGQRKNAAMRPNITQTSHVGIDMVIREVFLLFLVEGFFFPDVLPLFLLFVDELPVDALLEDDEDEGAAPLSPFPEVEYFSAQ